MNWSAEEVAERERIMKQQTARELAGALSALAIPELAQSLPPSLRTHNLSVATRATGRIRQPKGMNRTETRYSDYLELLKRAGEIAWYRFEGVTLKLADDTRYTPDFFVMTATGAFQAHEVKGFWRDDAKVKLKIAADLYPLEFVAVFAEKGGTWRYERF
jgi:hypothetical protein